MSAPALAAVPDTTDDDVAAPAPVAPYLHANLDDALAAFHCHLPVIAKELEAKVETNKGRNYSYEYADLATVSHAVLPRLGAQGLAWSTRPTREGGQLVLHYRLRHGASGEEIAGEWDLGRGTFQELGSAITYARRYCLLAVTGTFPGGEDDDGAQVTAAQREERDEAREQARAERERERAARNGGGQRPQGQGPRPNRTPPPAGQRPDAPAPEPSPADKAARYLLGRPSLDEARKAAAWLEGQDMVTTTVDVPHAHRRAMGLPDGELTLGGIATHMIDRFEDAEQGRALDEARAAEQRPVEGPTDATLDDVRDAVAELRDEVERSAAPSEEDPDPWASAPPAGEPPY